ncbi:uncharacterized protein LOC121886836 [Scomber scombrus]|uniref:Uncharacterized protein LOC121886836 n=1 Tax=Scomber scombrus TaxID=13677 RepID=A0AAV1NU72_SCOSC
METPDRETLLLQSLRKVHSIRSNVCSEPEEEKKDESEPNSKPESNQNTTEAKCNPSSLALIEFRIEQLYNRHLLLVKMQPLVKKSEDQNGNTTKKMTHEDSDELSEIETIQKELEELLEKKEMLEKQGNSTSMEGDEGMFYLKEIEFKMMKDY